MDHRVDHRMRALHAFLAMFRLDRGGSNVGLSGGAMRLIGLCGKAGVGKDTIADFLVRKHGFVKVSLADKMKRICKDVYGFTDTQLWGPSEERNKPDKRWVHSPRRLAWTCSQCCAKLFGPGPFEEKSLGLITSTTCTLCGVAWTPTNFHYVEIPEEYLTPRMALQLLGTEFGRACSPDTWVGATLATIQELFASQSKPKRSAYSAKLGLFQSNLTEDIAGAVVPDARFPNEIEAIRRAGGSVWRVLRPTTSVAGNAAQHASEVAMDAIPLELFKGSIRNDSSLADLENLVDHIEPAL